MTRGRRQAGTMRERPPGSGQWQLRAYAGDDPVTGRPVQVARTFKGGERAAARALAALVTEVLTEVHERKSDLSRATVGTLLDDWLSHVQSKHSLHTIHENKAKIEARIRPAFGDVLIDRLTPNQLDVQYLKWREEGLSESTVHHLHAILSAALRMAERWGWIEQAPTRRASPPPLRSTPIVTPTPEQLGRLQSEAAAKDAVLATAISLAVLTGARRGELCALRWSDVDLDAGKVVVSRSLTVIGREFHEGSTKTHQIRTLSLDDYGVGVLRSRLEQMRDLADRAGSPLVADPFVLSYNANGALPVDPSTITAKFTALSRQVGVKVRFHDLRHFSVSTLIAAGVDVRTVAERHGHAQPSMTLNRYAHALPERDRAAAGILGKVLGSATAASDVEQVG